MGSINRQSLLVSDKLRANCTAQDLQDIETWVRGYQSVVDLKSKHAAMTLPEQMGAAMAWFENASQEETRETRQLVEDIVATWLLLRSVLTRRGLI